MTQTTFVAERPEDVGVSSDKLEALFARVRRDVDEGRQGSASVAVARQGKIAGWAAFGSATQGGEEKSATPETLYHLYSSTKGVISIALWSLFEQGRITAEQKVCEIIPEFGTNGKDVLTVEQVMLMTAGFPLAPHRPSEWASHERLIERFQQWRLTWEPDSKWEYHATSSHWVQTELIKRITGQDYRQWMHESVAIPSGAETLYVGLPGELNARTADVYYAEEPVPPPGGWGEVTPESVLRVNDPAIRAVGNPGAGGIGSAADLALYYAPLVNGGVTATGERLLKPETIADMTRVRTKAHHRFEMQGGYPVNRGMGVVVAGDDGHARDRGFGSNTSGEAFGDAGAGGQIAWADPESGISLGYCTNALISQQNIAIRTSEI